MKTKRYIQTIELGSRTYEVSFNGSNELGEPNPANTDVKLRCFHDSSPLWLMDLGNQIMPDGPWHGFSLLLYFEEYLYCGAGNIIYKMIPETGEIIDKMVFGNTPISFMKRAPEKVLVLYSHYHFDDRKYGSNLIAINKEMQILWKAEVIPSLGTYGHIQDVIDNKVLCNTSEYACILDITTGKIVDKVFTK